ncbi:glycosyltransferase [Thermocrinis minervae]|uniref:Phosphatidylinositol alpha 1,6-mannosyltransferase n=1 Tax=Thermocrinis minervae TaxID=381751 RepID=A0A1M6T829_9AQUI|nr:glycosyltransferase [Thermocrinis minervae]SHK52918.1 phosphatidylinositol alpha 1,6-mannosyltransferase [Thermocrinis minervae]
MKVLAVAPYFHRKSGGIRRYILRRIKQLKDIQQVLVIPGKQKRVYHMDHVKVYEVPSFPIPLTGGYRFFNNLKDVKEVISLEEPDIVELHGTYLIAPYIVGEGYRLVIFYHSDAEKELKLLYMPQIIRNKLMKSVINALKCADAVLVPSQKYLNILKEWGVEKVHLVPLGVDCDTFSPSARDPYFDKLLGVDPHRTIKLLYVGRLSKDKNIDTLLELLDFLNPRLFSMVVVGAGPLSSTIEKEQKRRTNLFYMGHISSEEELAKIYASCDIFVSASEYETFCFSFVEAQASGLIVCAFDLNLETQLIKETLSRDFTAQGLAHTVYRAADLLSPGLRGYLHIKTKELFRWEKSFSKLLEVYEVLTGLRQNL